MPPPESRTSSPPVPPPPPPIMCCFPLPLFPTRMGRTPLVVVKRFHWTKIAHEVKGSLWDDIQLHDNQSWVTELDVSEIKSLFSTIATPPPPPRSKISTLPNPPPPPPPQSRTFVPPPPPPPQYKSFALRIPLPPPKSKTSAPPTPPPPPPQYKSFAPRTPPPPPKSKTSAPPTPPPAPLRYKSFAPRTPPPPPQRSKTFAPPTPPPPPPRYKSFAPRTPPPPPKSRISAPPTPPPAPLRYKSFAPRTPPPTPPPPPPRYKSFAPRTPPPPPKSKTSEPPTPPPPPPRYKSFAPRTPPPPPKYKTSAPPPPPRYKSFAPGTPPPPPPPRSKTFAPPKPPPPPQRYKRYALPTRPPPMPPLVLVDLRRANNCEIVLTRIKFPLPDMLRAVLALDSSALDIDLVENLIKFCPTEEEMEMLRNYTGHKEMLGKCEQFFMELMKVPRIEAKLRVFGFKITFSSQVKELKCCLNTINAAIKEVKESTKLRQIMQTILILGNALNQGTARGSAVAFRLESLLKLSDTRATNNQMNLMHYLCKLLGEKMPELLDFGEDLVHLEAASKIGLKTLAEEMQAMNKGLERVEQELVASENDGAISVGFRKVLKDFLDSAEAEVRLLIPLYSEVGRNADSLSRYFAEDPARCPFDQVTKILTHFMKTFIKSREENEKQAEAEKKKLKVAAMKYKPVTKKDTADSDKQAYLPDSYTQGMNKTELLESRP